MACLPPTWPWTAFSGIGCFKRLLAEPRPFPWGVVFPGLDPVPRHPAQLYSALLSLGLCAFLLWLYPRRRFDGQVFLAYVIGYALLRFGVEFVRENLIIWNGFTIAQVIAAGILVVAGVFTGTGLRCVGIGDIGGMWWRAMKGYSTAKRADLRRRVGVVGSKPLKWLKSELICATLRHIPELQRARTVMAYAAIKQEADINEYWLGCG